MSLELETPIFQKEERTNSVEGEKQQTNAITQNQTKNLEKEIIEKNEKNGRIIREDLEEIDTSGININIKEGKASLQLEFKFPEGEDLDIKTYEWKTSFFKMRNGNFHLRIDNQTTLIYTSQKEFKDKAYGDLKKELSRNIFKIVNLSKMNKPDDIKNLIIKKINTYTGIICNSLTTKNKNIESVQKIKENNSIHIPLTRKNKDISINITNETNLFERLMDEQEWSINGQEERTGKEERILIDFCENCREQIPEETRRDINEQDQYTLFYPKFAQAFSKL